MALSMCGLRPRFRRCLALRSEMFVLVPCHTLPERPAIIPLVSVQLFDGALGSDAQLVHGSLGCRYVVAVAFERHTRQWQSVLLRQQRDVGAIPMVLAVIADTGILQRLYERAIKIANSKVNLTLTVKQH